MKKKQGFTLIELIVVIAIIGVLAAILVPAMINYIAKARVMASNAAAKSTATAVASAMVSMAQSEIELNSLDGVHTYTGDDFEDNIGVKASDVDLTTDAGLESLMLSRIYNGFEDVIKVDTVSIQLNKSECKGVGIMVRGYPGSYPIAITADDYRAEHDWDSEVALNYAMS